MQFRTKQIVTFGAVVTLALSLGAACHEAGVETPTAPDMQTVGRTQAADQQKGKQPPDIQLQTASGTVCTKSTPPGPYGDRPAECVEVSGSASMSPGGSATFTCRGWGRSSVQLNDWYEVSADRPRSWWSDDQSIVTVGETSSPSATVSAVAPGTANVNCTIDGIIGSLQVTVTGTRTLASMFVTPNPVPDLLPGDGANVSTHFVDQYGQTDRIHPPVDEWQSDNTGVATVGEPFQYGGQVAHVTAIASAGPNTDGIAHVKARVGTIWSSSSQVRVKPAPRATTITVSPTSATINKNAVQAFTATVRDQNGNTMPGAFVTWTSSNTNVATVAFTGYSTANATGVGGGQATIQAAVDAISANATLTVLAPTTVTVDPASATVHNGSTLQLTATARDQQGNIITGYPVSWSSSDPSAVSVSSTGLVTGLTTGSQATITATIEGVAGTSSITVTYPRVSVSISGPTYIDTQGSYTWTANPQGGDGTYTYSWQYRDALNPNWVSAGFGRSVVKYVSKSTANSFVYRVTVTSAGDNSQASVNVQVDMNQCNPYCE